MESVNKGNLLFGCGGQYTRSGPWVKFFCANIACRRTIPILAVLSQSVLETSSTQVFLRSATLSVGSFFWKH